MKFRLKFTRFIVYMYNVYKVTKTNCVELTSVQFENKVKQRNNLRKHFKNYSTNNEGIRYIYVHILFLVIINV